MLGAGLALGSLGCIEAPGVTQGTLVHDGLNRTYRLYVPPEAKNGEPMLPDVDPQDGTRIRREVYAESAGGSEVILYAVEGGGHTWPGGGQYLPEWLIGKTSHDLDASLVVWDFFARHQRE